MPVKLYACYRSRGTRNIWLMDEMGIPYEQIPVLQAYRLAKPKAKDAPINTASRKFLKINPNGRIPALKDGKTVLCESLAINLYLARKFGRKLKSDIAAKTVAEEGLATMWSLWAVTEVEPHSIQILFHRMMKPEAERDEKVVKASCEALAKPLDVLEAHLAQSGGYMMGGRFTVADINVSENVRYAAFVPELFTSRPHLKKWMDGCHARPAYKAMITRRNAEPA
jgi:glutathione S-transferase